MQGLMVQRVGVRQFFDCARHNYNIDIAPPLSHSPTYIDQYGSGWFHVVNSDWENIRQRNVYEVTTLICETGIGWYWRGLAFSFWSVARRFKAKRSPPQKTIPHPKFDIFFDMSFRGGVHSGTFMKIGFRFQKQIWHECQ